MFILMKLSLICTLFYMQQPTAAAARGPRILIALWVCPKVGSNVFAIRNDAFIMNVRVDRSKPTLDCVTLCTLRKSRNVEISIVKNSEFDTFFREFQQIMSKVNIAHQMVV